MRLAFEIILAIPALLFAAALIVGALHRQRLRAVTANRSIGETAIPSTDTPTLRHSDTVPTPTLRHSDTPTPAVQLTESDFAAALMAVERLRARGDHAAADAMLASLHRRKLKEGKLFTEGNEGNEAREPAASPPASLPSLPSVENPVRLSESDFASALIAVERLRAQRLPSPFPP